MIQLHQAISLFAALALLASAGCSGHAQHKRVDNNDKAAAAGAGSGDGTAQAAPTPAKPAKPAKLCARMSSLATAPRGEHSAAADAFCIKLLAQMRDNQPQRYAKTARCIAEHGNIDEINKICFKELYEALASMSKSFKKLAKYTRRTSGQPGVLMANMRVVMFFEKHKQLPASSGWVPAKPCCSYADKRCPGKPQLSPAQQVIFGQLGGFREHYRYRYTRDGSATDAKYVIEARGDPDCDGKAQTFTLRGALHNGKMTQGKLEAAPPVK